MMTTSRQDLNKSKEFFYIGLSLLEQNNKTNVIPEMMQILTPQQIILMAQVFGGKSIKFPSTKELSVSLKSALYIYYVEIEKRSDEDASVILGASEHEMKTIREYKKQWEDVLKKELGNEFYALIRG